MGHFSVEIMRLPGQLSAKINTMLALRDSSARQADALFQPVLFATSIRSAAGHEMARLSDAVRATGIDPRIFGLLATGGSGCIS